jgi:hypothetical protein
MFSIFQLIFELTLWAAIIFYMFNMRSMVYMNSAQTKWDFMKAVEMRSRFKVLSIYSFMFHIFLIMLIMLKTEQYFVVLFFSALFLTLNIYINAPRVREAACLIVENSLTIENLKKRFYMTEYQANVTLNFLIKNGVITEVGGEYHSTVDLSGDLRIENFKKDVCSVMKKCFDYDKLLENFLRREK